MSSVIPFFPFLSPFFCLFYFFISYYSFHFFLFISYFFRSSETANANGRNNHRKIDCCQIDFHFVVYSLYYVSIISTIQFRIDYLLRLHSFLIHRPIQTCQFQKRSKQNKMRGAGKNNKGSSDKNSNNNIHSLFIKHWLRSLTEAIDSIILHGSTSKERDLDD